MGYLICGKCKGYYKLEPGESQKDFLSNCNCGGKVRFVENLDIVDPHWKPILISRKKTKTEAISEKTRIITSIPQKIRRRLQKFNQNLRYRVNTARNQSRIRREPQGLDMGMFNFLLNELNLKNIRWYIVIPVIIAVTLILAYAPGIFTLLTFVLFLIIGYLIDDPIIGAKNALIAGAISFFLGYLLTGLYLLIIPYAILGAINGAVCGWIGGYIRARIG